MYTRVRHFVVSVKTSETFRNQEHESSLEEALSAVRKSELKFHCTERFVSAAIKSTLGYKRHDLLVNT